MNGRWLRLQLLPHRETTSQGHRSNQCRRVLSIICNTDAAWRVETHLAGLAWIFNPSSTLPVTSGSQVHRLVSSALMAKGLAIREALLHAQHLGISKIWIKTDSESLVRALNSITKPRNLYGIVSDIESLSSLFDFCTFSFTPRNNNGLADSLAKACLQNSVISWSWGLFPSFFFLIMNYPVAKKKERKN